MKQSRLALRAKYKTWANKECKKRNSKVGLKRSSLVSANSRLDPFNGFALSFSGLALSSRLGVWCAKRRRLVEGEAREDFGVIQAATLTLLALIIGFTFSMALNRYDQRKLRGRRGQRHRHGIRTGRSAAGGRRSEGAGAAFYDTRYGQELSRINARTAKLQAELWSAVQVPASAQPNAVVALAVEGMNDVLNSQGYTQAAWWNRIPVAAWGLMAAIAICSNALVGLGARNTKREFTLLLILPLVVAIAFFLITDIDSPRGGFILVKPPNLPSLSQSLHSR